MKKFIFLLLLIFISGGAALYFGWVQIPEGKGALFFSTLTGYEEKILESGSFHWRWQKLIPGTSNLHMISLAPHKTRITINEKLPSGDIYSEFMPGNPEFMISADISVAYIFTEETVINFFTERNLPEEGLEPRYSEYDRMIKSSITAAFKSFLTSAEAEIPESPIHQVFSDAERIPDIISSEIHGIELIETAVNSLSFPDPYLYAAARQQYTGFLEKYEAIMLEEKKETDRIEAELDKRISALEKYGQLLTKYPVLIEYLKINPGIDILREGTAVLQE